MNVVMAGCRLLMLAVACLSTVHASLPADTKAIEHCISTRWGYSCVDFAMSSRRALINLSDSGLGIQVSRAIRSTSRGALVLGSAWVAREIVRDVRGLNREMRSTTERRKKKKGRRGRGAREDFMPHSWLTDLSLSDFK